MEAAEAKIEAASEAEKAASSLVYCSKKKRRFLQKEKSSLAFQRFVHTYTSMRQLVFPYLYLARSRANKIDLLSQKEKKKERCHFVFFSLKKIEGRRSKIGKRREKRKKKDAIFVSFAADLIFFSSFSVSSSSLL